MQVETAARLACPLCRRQFLEPSENALSTRLCQACQAMVLTAFRGSIPGNTQSTAAVPQTTTPLAIQHEEQSLDQGVVGAPAVFEWTPAEALASELQSRPPLSFDAQDPARFDFYQEEDSGYETSSSLFDSPESHEQGRFFEESVEPEVTGDQELKVAGEPHLSEHSSAWSESTVESAFDPGEVVEDRLKYQPPSVEQVGADEWQTSVATLDPDWDSNSEWPLMVAAPSSDSPSARPRLAIAAVAVIAILVAAAGFYFLIYRSSDSQERRVLDAKAPAVEPRAPSVGSAVTASLAPAAPTQSESAAATAPLPAEQTTWSSAEGRFSLQAASFVTQEGANEFAERLRRAGVPSYVVSADVLRRGRWFRVRVGRFNSAEDAQRFVGEAQQRARAAGIAVQLIVCQYEQP